MTKLNTNFIQKTSIIDYVQYLIDQGYTRDQLTIDENSEIVSINSIEKGSVGTAIDIRCPCRYKMIITGRAHLPYKTYVLALRLANRDNIEVAPDARIRILKKRTSEAITVIDTMFYKDLTTTKYLKIHPNKTELHEKCDIAKAVYKFNDSIEINGEEHLTIDVINPDITIDAKNIKLYLDIDLLEEE